MANNQIDYLKEFFTIVALEDGLTVKLSQNASEYRIDNGEWTSLPANTATPSINSGQKISFKITNPTIFHGNGIGTFTVNKAFNVEGNIMSLLYGDSFEGQTDLSGKGYAFYCLFFDCTTLKNAKNLILPATTLVIGCYSNMFYGCTGLTAAPELPATTLKSSCYHYMFYGCTGLTAAPELPATTLADECYRSMFEGCTGLTTAPELSATTLAYYCYNGMFMNCTGLITAPELPATTLVYSCYSSMFYGCTGLTKAPELPAATLAYGCYQYMFEGCTGLTTVPELPAITLANSCYNAMFRGCNKLNNITMLATNISISNCLTNWVDGVASNGTFVKAASMTSLPSGISGIPTGWTVVNIFNNVSPCIINHASESITFAYSDGLFTPTNEIIGLSQYFTKEELLSVQPECEITVTLQDKTDNVLVSDYVWANDKTLNDVLNELDVTKDVYDINVIITNVNAPEESGYYYYEKIDYSKEYFTIVALEDGLNVKLSQNASEYRIDNGEWTSLPANTATPSINSGQKISFKITNPTIFHGNGIGTFTVNKAFNVEGNIMSLLYGDSFEGQTDLSGKGYAFYCLFFDCTTLKNAKNLILPATTLVIGCYSNMFYGCTGLTAAPELPATTLKSSCYHYMFYGCTGLTAAPELPATTLADECYRSMFEGCTNLTTAPELPATTLTSYCYQYMFFGCTSLTTAPELPATTLAKCCYQYMFSGCSKLKYIKMLATDISASYCLSNWVNGVASNGTFVKNAAITSLPTGNSGIPTGWTIKDYVENNNKKVFLDKSGLITLWGIITNKFATKDEAITSVGIVNAADKTTLQFIYADNTAENPHTLDIVINPVSDTYAGLMTPEMLADLETAVDGTIGNLELNYNNTTKKLQLFDGAVTEGNVLTEIDATAFVNDGMLSSAELIVNPESMADGTYFKLVWNSDAGKTEPMYVNVTQLIDVYTPGDGIKIENKEISCTYTYTLLVANDSTLGGIKTGYAEVEGVKKYAVKVENENAYVAVPWEDTRYSNTVQNDNLVKLELSDSAFSINETALIDRLSGIDTVVKAKVESVAKATYEVLINVSTDTGNAVEINSTDKLTNAVELAETSIQGVGVNDNNIIGIEKDDTNNTVTLSAGIVLETAMDNANDTVQEISIGELEIKKDTDRIAYVAHDTFIGYFAITADEIDKICS